jgi:hypothetical protein
LVEEVRVGKRDIKNNMPEDSHVSPMGPAPSEYRITVITSDFQSEDASSILAIRSNIALSSNGRTCGFGPQCGGSNPSGATNQFQYNRKVTQVGEGVSLLN